MGHTPPYYLALPYITYWCTVYCQSCNITVYYTLHNASFDYATLVLINACDYLGCDTLGYHITPFFQTISSSRLHELARGSFHCNVVITQRSVNAANSFYDTRRCVAQSITKRVYVYINMCVIFYNLEHSLIIYVSMFYISYAFMYVIMSNNYTLYVHKSCILQLCFIWDRVWIKCIIYNIMQ